MNWFKRENYSEYRDRLLKSFPAALRSEVEAVLDILPFGVNRIKLTDRQIYKLDNLIGTSVLTVYLNSELLTIPCRLYFNEPGIDKENKLTGIQRTILNCIYLRHHDGYLRQRRLEKLIDKNEHWIIPFALQLLGEYVIEILQVLDKHVTTSTIDNYGGFVKQNPAYWQLTESRMISYWNAYYRQQFPKLKDYPGRHIVDRIEKRMHDLPKVRQTPVK